MKKYYYKFVFVVSILGILGFGQCQSFTNFILVLMYGEDAGRLFTGADASGVSEIYSIAVGDQGAIYTAAGRSPADWVERQSGTINTLRFVKVFNDSTIALAVAVGDAGTVLQSTDKGENWTDRSIPGVTKKLFSLIFIDYQGGDIVAVVCGEDGVMYKSTNTGSGWDWAEINTGITENLNSIVAIDGELYIAAGEKGTIIKTYDSGQTWEYAIIDTSININRLFNGIEIEAYGYLWAVADSGKIYATTNYGITWFPQISGVTDNLYDVIFSTQNDGIIAGANGVVRYTANGGFNWQEDQELNGLTTKDIVSISIIDENTASALLVSNFNKKSSIGTDTTFFLSVSSEPFVGVDDEVNNIPSDFILEQNYPNPFNPSTTIQFSIPEQSFVTLEIFNALGEKITTLVSKELNAGNHNYDWKVENMPSGIYLYKLQAGSFVETKKLVLLK